MEELEAGAAQGPAAPQSTIRCKFHLQGYCWRGASCHYVHDLPDTSANEGGAVASTSSPTLPAVHASDDEGMGGKNACSICYETPQTFAVLPSCSHSFCIPCIKEWRYTTYEMKASAIRSGKSCPLCRCENEYFFPSPRHFTIKEAAEKATALQAYKLKLSKIPCKAFKQNPKYPSFGPYCDRGSDCLYSHTLNGTPHLLSYTHEDQLRKLEVLDSHLSTIQRTLELGGARLGPVLHDLWYKILRQRELFVRFGVENGEGNEGFDMNEREVGDESGREEEESGDSVEDGDSEMDDYEEEDYEEGSDVSMYASDTDSNDSDRLPDFDGDEADSYTPSTLIPTQPQATTYRARANPVIAPGNPFRRPRHPGRDAPAPEPVVSRVQALSRMMEEDDEQERLDDNDDEEEDERNYPLRPSAHALPSDDTPHARARATDRRRRRELEDAVTYGFDEMEANYRRESGRGPGPLSAEEVTLVASSARRMEESLRTLTSNMMADLGAYSTASDEDPDDDDFASSPPPPSDDDTPTVVSVLAGLEQPRRGTERIPAASTARNDTRPSSSVSSADPAAPAFIDVVSRICAERDAREAARREAARRYAARDPDPATIPPPPSSLSIDSRSSPATNYVPRDHPSAAMLAEMTEEAASDWWDDDEDEPGRASVPNHPPVEAEVRTGWDDVD